jgi:two-component system, OmpR family, sensor kinase
VSERAAVPPRPGHRPGDRPRRRWSLRTRLVVSSTAMIAVVAAVIGLVTTFALRSFLYQQLDGQVRSRTNAAALDPFTDRRGPLGFINGPGMAPGTIGARFTADGRAVTAGVTQAMGPSRTAAEKDLPVTTFSAEQIAAFAGLGFDGGTHTVTIPGRGTYRVQALHIKNSTDTAVIGMSTGDVDDAIRTLVVVELCVTGVGLIAAGLTGFVLMRISLEPLRRVAATATRVSRIRLDRGEVALHERVPDADTDARTEVGQVGAAFNRMLDHVGAALHARHESETRVRQFVADASHELRTPLASIRGYAELTRRGREDIGHDTRYALGRIESEASRMTTLVEDLLLLARLDAGRPLELAEIDLSPLVVDAVSDARTVGREHRWRLELPDEPALVVGDPQRLQQVLTNLLANARTHTPPGTTVTARLVLYGGEVLVEVADNGPGIPPDLLPHIFERFARGDASRSRAAGSTGLGLAIVQAVASAHGGRITIESLPGNTIFRVHLPVMHSQAAHSLVTTS